MQLPNVKDLKKLADACRKVGIKHFKSPDFEFTLTDELPEAPRRLKTARAESSSAVDRPLTDSSPSEEELLFWSVGEMPTELEPSQAN